MDNNETETMQERIGKGLDNVYFKFGSVLTLVVTLMGATWTLAEMKAELTTQLDSIEARVQHVEQQLAHEVEESQFGNWIMIFRAQNPDIDVPDLPE